MRHDVADESGVRVMAERCPTCIFTPGAFRLMPGRLKDMVDDAKGNDSAIICHETHGDEKQACCRGFYELEEHGPTAPLQIATRLGLLVPWTRSNAVRYTDDDQREEVG